MTAWWLVTGRKPTACSIRMQFRAAAYLMVTLLMVLTQLVLPNFLSGIAGLLALVWTAVLLGSTLFTAGLAMALKRSE